MGKPWITKIAGDRVIKIGDSVNYKVTGYKTIKGVDLEAVNWTVFILENNGWRELNGIKKPKASQTSFIFKNEKLIGRQVLIEAYGGSPERKEPPGLLATIQMGNPKIVSISLRDTNGNKFTETPKYGQTISAVIGTTNMVGTTLYLSLWERDTVSNSGHDSKENQKLWSGKTVVHNRNGEAKINIPLTPEMAKKANNNIYDKFTHEYYLTVQSLYTKQVYGNYTLEVSNKVIKAKGLGDNPPPKNEKSTQTVDKNNVNTSSKKEGCFCNKDLTAEIFKKIAVHAPSGKINMHLSGLNNAFKKSQINSCLRKIHFLAQVIHESGSLQFTREIGASDSSYGGYPGRGLIQLTGKKNYIAYGKFVGEDVTSSNDNKKKVEKNPHAAQSAGWYWSEKAILNDDADRNDFIFITYAVNGGFNGYNDRLLYVKNGFLVLYRNCVNDKEKNTNYDFKDSKAYNTLKASFGWGLWHDAGTNKKGCTKSTEKALEGYERFITLHNNKGKGSLGDHKWYGYEPENIRTFVENRIKALKT